MTTSAPVREPTNRCPFCGTNVRLTKEHVWPQWLRSQGPAYGLWAPHYQGQRSTVSGTHAITNEHGVVEYVPRPGPAAGKFLATVTVKVCRDCNRQWNERLEKPVQELLRPAFTGETTPLTPTDQRLLALWAVKCFVGYARATIAPGVDPFPESERRRQAKPSADPNDRWDLWIGWSPDAEAAHMALSVRPTAFTHRDDDLTQPPPNNTANAGWALTVPLSWVLAPPQAATRDHRSLHPSGDASQPDSAVAQRRTRRAMAEPATARRHVGPGT